jgi:chloramphenicol O-acetyltransferase type B
MENPFGSWLESRIIRDHLTNPNIEAGDYSYYSGYYHGKPFEDHCVRYLLGDGSTRASWDSGEWGTEVDRLIIGKFCSIASTSLAKRPAVAFCARGTPGLATMSGSARKR